MRLLKNTANVKTLNLLFILLLTTCIIKTAAAQAIDNPITEKIPKASIELSLTEIAKGFTAPLGGSAAPLAALQDQLFITDQIGVVWRVDLSSGEKTTFIDVQDRLISLGAFSPGGYDERGLLGFVFHPQYVDNGLVYLFTSEPTSANADFTSLKEPQEPNHQSVLLELKINNITSLSGAAEIQSQRELLRLDQPQYNHNGGALAFDSKSHLYIGVGDGGSSDDQGDGHSAQGNGSDLSNPFGAILRIDPTGSNSKNKQYGIPTDNPFVNQVNKLDEIYAYGLRNPWKISFDNAGTLYAADVGQNHIEEINIIKKGRHYGWPYREGRFWFNNNGTGRGFATKTPPSDFAKIDLAFEQPLFQYDHDEGISITGGYVYQGPSNKALLGKYIFADFRSRIFIGDIEKKQIYDSKLTPEILLFSFAVDHHKEIYVMGNKDANTQGESGKLFKLTTKTEVQQ